MCAFNLLVVPVETDTDTDVLDIINNGDDLLIPCRMRIPCKLRMRMRCTGDRRLAAGNDTLVH